MRTTILAATFALAALPFAASAADPQKGKLAFEKNGCWQCHGYAGQGGAAGKTLAPKPMPYEAFNVFVRNSNGPMPPYPKEILSDACAGSPPLSAIASARATFQCREQHYCVDGLGLVEIEARANAGGDFVHVCLPRTPRML